MRVVIYAASANHPKFETLLHDFGNAIATVEDTVDVVYGEQITPWCRDGADLNIIWGSWKDRNTPWHEVKRAVVAEDTPFLVLETPVMGRKPVKDVMDDTWYRVGINGFLGDTGFHHTVGSPGDRYLKMSEELDIAYKPWKTSGGPIVICLQLPGDASLRGADISQWATMMAHEAKHYTDKQILIRTPQLPRQFDFSGMPDGVLYQEGTAENLQSTMDHASCFVTYSSGVGTDAVINGTPTVAYNSASMVYGIVPNRIQWLETFTPTDRRLCVIVSGRKRNY